jgi:type II secretory pathway pseudopilin PulG
MPRAPARQKTQPWVIAIVVGAVLLFLLVVVGLIAAMAIPAFSKVRETAQRSVDASNLRQVVQASLLYAADHNGRLPMRSIPPDGGSTGTRELATIQAVAAALARDGGLNDSSMWFSVSDRATAMAPASAIASPIVFDDGTLNTEFMGQTALAWDFVTGLTTSDPVGTPVAWTRGLRRDGTWDAKAGVHGAKGGHIAFLGGNVQFFRNLSAAGLKTQDGQPTTDILKTLPAGRRVVGAGPGTLHGAEGGGP